MEFRLEREENTEAVVWRATITAERNRREEREKHSGANLAENGGYLETTTRVQLKLTGRRAASDDATNVYVALASGEQGHVDYEYDRYKIDEGCCRANAVPYMGPKEATRTTTTTYTWELKRN